MRINKKGFTLIEMLAVVVILAIISSIAVASVSKYIEKSRRETYVATAREYMTIASNMIAQQKIIVRDSNTVYYIHINNLSTQKKLVTSPYGKWADAYVVVTVEPGTNELIFYWVSVDVKGYRVDLVKESELNANRIHISDDLVISPSSSIGGRNRLVIYDKNGNKIID